MSLGRLLLLVRMTFPVAREGFRNCPRFQDISLDGFLCFDLANVNAGSMVVEWHFQGCLATLVPVYTH